MKLSLSDLDLIKAALAEDLAGGDDITSVATIDAKATAKADFTE
jgi:nicotinate-nucleotide pyrophosphorylase (carboxylating)